MYKERMSNNFHWIVIRFDWSIALLVISIVFGEMGNKGNMIVEFRLFAS